METKKFELGEVVSCKDVKTQGWRAWLNTMPPGPSMLHVRGEALVGNPGIYAVLRKNESQEGRNATVRLDLILIQQPGIWPQVMTWAQASYEEVEGAYKQVDIYCEDQRIASMEVQIVT